MTTDDDVFWKSSISNVSGYQEFFETVRSPRGPPEQVHAQRPGVGVSKTRSSRPHPEFLNMKIVQGFLRRRRRRWPLGSWCETLDGPVRNNSCWVSVTIVKLDFPLTLIGRGLVGDWISLYRSSITSDV